MTISETSGSGSLETRVPAADLWSLPAVRQAFLQDRAVEICGGKKK